MIVVCAILVMLLLGCIYLLWKARCENENLRYALWRETTPLLPIETECGWEPSWLEKDPCDW